MNTKKNVSIVRHTTVLALLGATLTAGADQLENRTASDCVAVTGTVSARTDGGLENTSAATATVVCPVERRSNGGAFTTFVSARVWAVDQSAATGVCCRVVSVNPSGGATVESASVCTTGASSGVQSIDLPEISDPYSYSHFFVRCDIPAVSGVARSRLQTVRNVQH